jgi:chromosome segregation ATPase
LTDTTPIEEMHRHLVREIGDLQTRIAFMEHSASITAAENATLREVNAAQAEQLRKAQERIRAAEEKCDLLNKAQAQMQRTMDRLEAERDRAWSEAISAAADLAWRHHVWDMTSRGRNPEECTSSYRTIAAAIRSLAKEAGE